MILDPKSAALAILAKHKPGGGASDDDAGLDSAVEDFLEALTAKDVGGAKKALRSFIEQHRSAPETAPDEEPADE